MEVKANDTEIQKANISILFNDEFFDSVETGTPFKLSFELANGEKIEKEINAAVFLDKMAKANAEWGEPKQNWAA